jgi:hypothetical protein
MRIVVRCEDCCGYGYIESKDMSSARTTDCYACDGTGEVTYTETYESFYEAEQDYINQDVIRIEDNKMILIIQDNTRILIPAMILLRLVPLVWLIVQVEAQKIHL